MTLRTRTNLLKMLASYKDSDKYAKLTKNPLCPLCQKKQNPCKSVSKNFVSLPVLRRSSTSEDGCLSVFVAEKSAQSASNFFFFCQPKLRALVSLWQKKSAQSALFILSAVEGICVQKIRVNPCLFVAIFLCVICEICV